MADLVVEIQDLREAQNCKLVVLKGTIDGKTLIHLQTKLASVLESGTASLVMDFEHVKYINSSGLGYFVSLHDSFDGVERKMIFINVQPKVKMVMDMLGLNSFFQILKDQREALGALNGDGGTREQPKVEEIRKPTTTRTEKKPSGIETSFIQAKVETAKQIQQSTVLDKPQVITCDYCRAQLEIREVGTYRCPKCMAAFTVTGTGRPQFVPRRAPYPLQLTLNFTPESKQGLLEFTRLFAKKANLGELSTRQLMGVVEKIFDAILASAYGGNSNNLFHVLFLVSETEIEMKFIDYGKAIHDSTLSKQREIMDRFEIKTLPNGGNLINVSKGSL